MTRARAGDGQPKSLTIECPTCPYFLSPAKGGKLLERFTPGPAHIQAAFKFMTFCVWGPRLRTLVPGPVRPCGLLRKKRKQETVPWFAYLLPADHIQGEPGRQMTLLPGEGLGRQNDSGGA
jgi:hypothetical protein